MKMLTKNDVLGLAVSGEVYSINYCKAQYLLMFTEKVGYNGGVYGWNYDVFMVGDDVIITGYQPFKAKKIDYNLLKKYEDEARRVQYEGGTFVRETTDGLLMEMLRINKDLAKKTA